MACANCNQFVDEHLMIAISDFVDDIQVAESLSDVFLSGDKSRLLDTRPSCSSAVSNSPYYIDRKFCPYCVDLLTTCFKIRQLFLKNNHQEGFVSSVLNDYDANNARTKSGIDDNDNLISHFLSENGDQSSFDNPGDDGVSTTRIDEPTADDGEPDPLDMVYNPCPTPIVIKMELMNDEGNGDYEMINANTTQTEHSLPSSISSRSMKVRRKKQLSARYGLKSCRVVLNRLPEQKPIESKSFDYDFGIFEEVKVENEYVTVSDSDEFEDEEALTLNETEPKDLQNSTRSEKGEHYCIVCSLYFSHRAILLVHIQLDHQGQPQTGRPLQFNCGICFLKFQNRVQLVQHTFLHTGENRYKCSFEDCPFSSVRVTDVRRHETQVHKKPFIVPSQILPTTISTTNIKGETQETLVQETRRRHYFKCNVRGCCSSFDHYAHLLSHVASNHLFLYDANPHRCGLCDFECFANQTLDDHMFTHTGESIEGVGIVVIYKMDDDGYTFEEDESKNIAANRQTYLAIGTKRICVLCGIVVSSMSHLRDHVRSHGIPTFSCDICSKPFKHMRSLKRHYVENHTPKSLSDIKIINL